MSENPESSEIPESSENPEIVESPVLVDAPAPAKKRIPRRRIAAVAGSVLLLGAVIGGTGYTVVTVQDADRDPGKPSWKFPSAAKDEGTAEEAKGLRALLMPYEENGFAQGPDLAEFGSDAELSGKQATALRKESLSGLSAGQRRQLEKRIDRQRIKGIVMRSYLSADMYALYDDKSVTVGVVLTQMGSHAAVEDVSTSQNELFEALDIFRKGPKIEGHKDAKCFLNPKDKDEKLDRMRCSASVGDVLVEVTASAVAPMDKQAVATFLSSQLDRIDDPGKAV
ncbi:hypothetical protein [Streptomyces sp. NPDC046909]|uniref:hypothetical protein n=1 Tax=Streptomyces sp. NPDC046909 TaxID=3155617 RepID=UPI0033F02448